MIPTKVYHILCFFTEPSKPIRVVVHVNNTVNNVSVQWHKPVHPNGILKQYIVSNKRELGPFVVVANKVEVPP